MPVRSDIQGLTEVGATAQTIALAEVLYRSAPLRQQVRSYMDLFEDPTTCSGEDGDRRAKAALAFAAIIRQYKGPEIN